MISICYFEAKIFSVTIQLTLIPNENKSEDRFNANFSKLGLEHL